MDFLTEIKQVKPAEVPVNITLTDEELAKFVKLYYELNSIDAIKVEIVV